MIYILLGLVAGALIEGVACVVLLRKAQNKLKDSQYWKLAFHDCWLEEIAAKQEIRKLLEDKTNELLLVTESKDRIRALAQEAIDLGMATADELHESNRRLTDAENLIDDLTLETIN